MTSHTLSHCISISAMILSFWLMWKERVVKVIVVLVDQRVRKGVDE